MDLDRPFGALDGSFTWREKQCIWDPLLPCPLWPNCGHFSRLESSRRVFAARARQRQQAHHKASFGFIQRAQVLAAETNKIWKDVKHGEREALQFALFWASIFFSKLAFPQRGLNFQRQKAASHLKYPKMLKIHIYRAFLMIFKHCIMSGSLLWIFAAASFKVGWETKDRTLDEREWMTKAHRPLSSLATDVLRTSSHVICGNYSTLRV